MKLTIPVFKGVNKKMLEIMHFYVYVGISWRGGREAEGTGLLNRYTELIRIEGSNPSLSARFFEEDFSHCYCEHSQAVQKPQYLRTFQCFILALDTYLTFSNFTILPLKSPFVRSPSPIHANTLDEGTHAPKSLIYLGFVGRGLFDDS